jgi:hypothetical protein
MNARPDSNLSRQVRLPQPTSFAIKLQSAASLNRGKIRVQNLAGDHNQPSRLLNAQADIKGMRRRYPYVRCDFRSTSVNDGLHSGPHGKTNSNQPVQYQRMRAVLRPILPG